jgi:quercetin dioxygenase-like cupin family protein
MWRRLILSCLASLLSLTTLSCHRADLARTVIDNPAPPHQQVAQAVAPVKPLILGVNQGERRRRRFAVSAPNFILKVDPQNGGSRDITMGYEDLPPGGVIPPHWHKMADEILFIHRGSGVVELGDEKEAFTEGATIFIPKDVRVTVRNTGSGPLSVAFFFSKPGFETFLREMSALEGESFVPLSPQELRAIRKRHEWHTVYEDP